jgi:hypothetical protein
MASFSTFNDPMTASTQNTTLWGGNFGTLSWAGGGMTVTNPASYTAYGGDTTTLTYDLTAANCYCSMASVGNQALASLEVIPVQLNNVGNTNKLFFYINTNTLGAYKTIASVQTLITSVAYSGTTHKWFRIAEGAGRPGGTSGTSYFDTSSDGITWTSFTSLANPFVVTALVVQPSMGTFAAETTSTTAKWNSFSTPPIVATKHNLTLLGIGN